MRLALLILVVASALAVPVKKSGTPVREETESNSCAVRCSGISSKYEFQPGKVYEYKYQAKTRVQVAGTSRKETHVTQTATVSIASVSDCEFALKLSGVRLQGPDSNAVGNWNSELERRNLRFSFDDGVISHVCPDPQEPAWVLNIKRGILSTIQNALQGTSSNADIYETDISGTCPTQYEVSEASGTKTFVRNKDLVACRDYHGHHSALRGVKYHLKSDIQNSPLVDSKQRCEHIISRNALRKAVCTETHRFQPFSTEKGGIIATTEQTLELEKESRGVVPTEVGPQQTMEFDHSEFELDESNKALTDAKHNLRHLAATSDTEVRPETPGMFTELVYNLRRMNLGNLKSLVNEHMRKEKEKVFLMDALPMCGTETCVELMVDQLQKGGLTDVQKETWLASLVLVPRPTKKMVESVLPLVTKMPDKALLGISSLVHGYCKVNPMCAEVSEVARFVETLSRHLGNNCQARNAQEIEKVILALKAIGNVGHVRTVIPTLVKCLKREENPMDIRLSAIQALRRMPCGDQESELMTVLKDQTENIEVRLTAFMVSMNCPNAQLMQTVQKVLETEKVNQITSFMWSYLKEKQSSSNPSVAELASVLRKHNLGYKFNRDPRKYSRFVELGKIMEKVNMGAHLDAAWIFSPESYLPTQGFLNLTLHLFGTSVNLLEVGGRAQGLDRLLQNLMGPNGYFSESWGDVDTGRNVHSRNANQRVSQLSQAFHRHRTPRDKLDMSMYLKVFGDELMYARHEDVDVMNAMRDMMDVEKILNKLEHTQTMSVQKNLLFLDSTVTLPTITGLPLRLAVNGTTSINVEFTTKMNVRNVLRAPHNMKMEATVKPSAALELATMLAVHTGPVKTGVRMLSRVHSSTGFTAKLETTGSGQETKLTSSLELPKETMEIIDIQSQIFSIESDRQMEEPGIQRGRFSQQGCTAEPMARFTGLRICYDLQYPQAPIKSDAPHFPLTGPFKAKLSLEKADPNLRSYEFSTSIKSTPSKKSAELSFDTPGSKIDREVMVKVEYEQGKSLGAHFKVPGKEVHVQGAVKSESENKQTARVSLTIDQSRQFALTGSIETRMMKGRNSRYLLTAEGKAPNREDLKLDGYVEIPSSTFPRFATEFKLENLFDEPVEMKTILSMGGQSRPKYDVEFMWRCPDLHVGVKAFREQERREYGRGLLGYLVPGTIELSAEYKRPKVDPTLYKVTYKAEKTKETSGDVTKFTGKTNLECSWDPLCRKTFEWVHSEKPSANMVDSRVTFSFIPGVGEKSTLFLHGTSRIERSGKRHLTFASKFTHPKFNWEYGVKADYLNQLPQKFTGKVDLDTPTMKDIKGELNFENNNDPDKLDVEFEGKLEYPGREMRVVKSLEKTGPHVYHYNGLFQWQKGQQVEMEGDLKLKQGANEYELQLDAEATMTGRPSSLKIHKRVKVAPAESKYIGYLRRGTENIYDFKLHTLQESEQKTSLQTHIKSDVLNDLDYALSGSLESHSRTAVLKFGAQKDSKDWLKGEFVVPSHPTSRDPQKRVKGQVIWGLDTSEPKEMLLEYKLDVPRENQRDHQIQVKTDIGDHLNYNWVAKVHKGNGYKLNMTTTKNNKQIMDMSVGVVHSGPYTDLRDLAVDMNLKTLDPLPKRHYSTLLTFHRDQTTISGSGHAECLISKNKVSYLFAQKYTYPNGQHRYEYDLALRMNDMELVVDNWLQGKGSAWKGKYHTHTQWAPNKKITEDVEFDFKPWPVTMKMDLKTPFETLSQSTWELQLGGSSQMRTYKTELQWNNNNKLGAELKGTMSLTKTDVDAVLESSFDAFKKIEGQVEWDLENDKRDVDLALKWNGNKNILRVFHKMTPRPLKVQMGFQSKIRSRVDAEGQLDLSLDTRRNKYTADGSLEVNRDKYELDVNLDSNSGSVEIKTPSQTLKNGKLHIRKVRDGEYVIETDRNGQPVLTLTGIVKMSNDKHEIKMEVDKTSQPFSIGYKGEFTNSKWLVMGEVVRDPNKPTKKIYGVELRQETKSSEVKEGQLSVTTPSRVLMTRLERTDQWPRLYKVNLEFSPNTASNRRPTSVEISTSKRGNTLQSELHVTDPSLPKGIKGTMKATSVHNEDACRNSLEITLDYSGNPQKVLTIKSHLNYESKDGVPKRVNKRPMSIVQTTRDFQFQMEHPATNLYTKTWMKFTQELTTEGSLVTLQGDSGMEFKNAKRETKQYALSADMKPWERMAEFKLVTPEDRWMLELQRPEEGEMELVLSRNDEPMYSFHRILNSQDKTALLEIRKLHGKREVLLHISARLANKDMGVVRVWHTENSRRIDDIEVIVQLHKADLLKTKFFVRPGLNRELSYAATRGVQEVSSGRGNTGGAQLREFYSGLADTHQQISDDVWTQAQPMTNYWNNEINDMTEWMGPVLSDIRDSLSLYLSMSKEVFLAFLDILEKTMDEIIKTVPSDSLQQSYRAMKDGLSSIPQMVGEMSQPLMDAIQSLRAVTSDFYDSMRNLGKWAEDNLNVKQMRETFDEIWRETQKIPIVRQILQWLRELKDSVSNIQMRDVRREIKQYYGQASDNIRSFQDALSSWWDRWGRTIMDYEIGRTVVNWLKELFQRLQTTYGYMDPEDKVQKAVSWFTSQVRSYNPNQWRQYFPRMTVNNPEDGRYEMEIPLPTQVHSLEQIGQTFDPETLQALRTRLQDKFSEYKDMVVGAHETASQEHPSDFSVWDTVYSYKPRSMKPWDWIPPFQSTALLIGNQHIVTFDGRIVDFAADCDYLLARDFHDGHFTISASFGTEGRQVVLTSIKVQTREQEIEMKRDGSVKVNGNQQDLPWQKMDELTGRVHVEVKRYGSKVKLMTSDGLKVKCSDYYHVCKVVLPGHYHGKSAGLLGTNDNEPSNDFLLPSGQISENVQEFGQEWHVGNGNCKTKTNVAETKTKSHRLCTEYFQSPTSPFRACFKQVSPTPFKKMCELDIGSARFQDDSVVCNISAAYWVSCHLQGVELSMPNDCLECNTPKGFINEGMDVRVETNELPRSADVLFVVEERKDANMEWVKTQLGRMATQIQSEFRSKRVSDVNFGIVGFSGPGVHYRPHFHTGNGELNLNERDLGKAIANLVLNVETLVDQEPVDPMEAMMFAAQKFPFRAATQKIVVLFAATKCTTKTVSYYDLQNELMERGITFHVVSMEAVELSSGPSNKIFGFDAGNLFGGSESRRDLVAPHDSCTILAQETNGTVFSGVSQHRNKLVQEFPKRIVDKVELACQVCECQCYKGLPKTYCYPCQLPQPVSLTNGNGFFNQWYLNLKPGKSQTEMF